MWKLPVKLQRWKEIINTKQEKLVNGIKLSKISHKSVANWNCLIKLKQNYRVEVNYMLLVLTNYGFHWGRTSDKLHLRKIIEFWRHTCLQIRLKPVKRNCLNNLIYPQKKLNEFVLIVSNLSSFHRSKSPRKTKCVESFQNAKHGL